MWIAAAAVLGVILGAVAATGVILSWEARNETKLLEWGEEWIAPASDDSSLATATVEDEDLSLDWE